MALEPAMIRCETVCQQRNSELRSWLIAKTQKFRATSRPWPFHGNRRSAAFDTGHIGMQVSRIAEVIIMKPGLGLGGADPAARSAQRAVHSTQIVIIDGYIDALVPVSKCYGSNLPGMDKAESRGKYCQLSHSRCLTSKVFLIRGLNASEETAAALVTNKQDQF